MNKSSKEILTKISSNVYMNSTRYQFDKHKVYNEKFKKGNLAVYNWVSELCYFYLTKEKALTVEFQELIKQKKEELSKLDKSDYKDGLMNAFTDIEGMFKDCN